MKYRILTTLGVFLCLGWAPSDYVEVKTLESTDDIQECPYDVCMEVVDEPSIDEVYSQAFLNPSTYDFVLNENIKKAKRVCEIKMNGGWFKENFRKNSYLCHSQSKHFSAVFTTDDNNKIMIIRIKFFDSTGQLNFIKEFNRFRSHWSKVPPKEINGVTSFDTARWSVQFSKSKNRDEYIIYAYNLVYLNNL